MRERFAVSRGARDEQRVVIVAIADESGHTGRGEACGLYYAGETPEVMIAEIEAVRGAIEAGADRAALQTLLPANGARCALDAALWDLDAKRSGVPAFRAAGLDRIDPVKTCHTIGIRTIADYRRKAAELAAYAWLKVKVGPGDPTPVVEAVRAGAPNAKLVVDPNQAWSVDELETYAGPLAGLGVVVLEQPIPVGAEATLDHYECPIALAADELIGTAADLPKAAGRFDLVNIKLDKTGGLTEALSLADAAEAAGFKLMVGCMAGSSLAMAPAMILAQRCAVVDLDGPLLQAEDWPNGLVYRDGVIDPPTAAFWG
jgi:L-alanine-DL-glutamate epimerase-like enolase superfamily enzyme